MMKRVILTALLVGFASNGLIEQAQAQRPVRPEIEQSGQFRQSGQLMERLQNNTSKFRDSLKQALDRSNLNGTDREKQANELVKEFKKQVDRVRDRQKKGDAVLDDARQMLRTGNRIDQIMQRQRMGREAERDWALVRADLNQVQLIVSRIDGNRR
jgi:DNA mismatch repair ATPase MutS